MHSATIDSTSWKDGKRHLWLLGAPIMALPILGIELAGATGWGLFYWFAPLFIYLAIPAMDLLIGEDRSNPPEARVPTLERERYYRYAVYAAVPIQYLSFFWGAWVVGTQSLAWWEYLGVAISVGGAPLRRRRPERAAADARLGSSSRETRGLSRSGEACWVALGLCPAV